MIVLKFGGTSLGNSQRLARAAARVIEHLDDDPIVVVSAVGGVTNLLIRACEEAAKGRSLYNELLSIHTNILREASLPLHLLDDLFESLRTELIAISHAASYNSEILDSLLAFGERLSSRIFASFLTLSGIDAAAWDAGDVGMLTDRSFGRAKPLKKSVRQISSWAKSLRKGEVPVVTGFIGRTEDGRTTTLGRGGSDYSAAWIAAAVDAKELEIWTDVNGVMTADPRVVPEARSICELAFDEAAEMAFRGAKVLHPNTLQPVRESAIPVRVLNSLVDDDRGTLIVERSSFKGVKCCTSLRDLLLWQVFDEFGADRNEIIRLTLNELSERSLEIMMLVNSESGFAVVTPYQIEYSEALCSLASKCRASVSTGKALLSLVGEGIAQSYSHVTQALAVFDEKGIRPDLFAASPTGRSISFIVNDKDLPTVLRGLHSRLSFAVG
ncbi:MAG: aspartate kinase [Planctomycetota bacterium]